MIAPAIRCTNKKGCSYLFDESVNCVYNPYVVSSISLHFLGLARGSPHTCFCQTCICNWIWIVDCSHRFFCGGPPPLEVFQHCVADFSYHFYTFSEELNQKLYWAFHYFTCKVIEFEASEGDTKLLFFVPSSYKLQAFCQLKEKRLKEASFQLFGSHWMAFLNILCDTEK